MGRGKRNQAIALSDSRQSRQRLVPAELTTRLIGDAHDAPEAGARVQLVRTKGAAGGVRRGTRGSVRGQTGPLLEVSWDDGRMTQLRLGDDHYLVITASERLERLESLRKSRLEPQSRVAARRLRSPAAKARLKRGWRGTLNAVREDGQVEVTFDELDEGIVLDPLLDTLENVTGEEQARARELALARLEAGLGMRLELTADIPGEATLKAGMQGTVVDFNGNKLGVDWDNGLSRDLLPECDLDYVRVLARPTETPG